MRAWNSCSVFLMCNQNWAGQFQKACHVQVSHTQRDMPLIRSQCPICEHHPTRAPSYINPLRHQRMHSDHTRYSLNLKCLLQCTWNLYCTVLRKGLHAHMHTDSLWWPPVVSQHYTKLNLIYTYDVDAKIPLTGSLSTRSAHAAVASVTSQIV